MGEAASRRLTRPDMISAGENAGVIFGLHHTISAGDPNAS
jgi:hypothetical protein